MPISLKSVAVHLSAYEPEFVSLQDERLFIQSINHLNQLHGDPDPSVLYIGEKQFLPDEFVEKHQPINLLIINGQHLQIPIKPASNINLILLKQATKIEEVFSKIENALLQSQKDAFQDSRLVNGSVELIRALANNGGIQTLIDIGYQMLGNPFNVLDTSWKCLGSSKSETHDDNIWHELSSIGFLSRETVSYYVNNKFLYRLLKSRDPFYWNDDNILYPRIMGRIAVDDKPIGIIGVIGKEKPFFESDFEMVSTLCNALSAELQKDQFIHYTKGVVYEDFIRDLLEGRINDEKAIEERITYLIQGLKKYIFVFTIDVRGFDKTRSSLSYLQHSLETLIENSKSIVYNDYIVIIASHAKKKNFMESGLDQLKEYMQKANLQGGVSECFQNLKDLREYYDQSLCALKAGTHLHQGETLYFYHKYDLFRIADSCAAKDNIMHYCHPSIFTLIEYDQKYQTDYTRSLYVYLISLGNLSESASKLRIHRNTMIYRIEKIQEILNVDLNSSDTVLHLHMSFKLLEYDKSYNPFFMEHK